MPRGPHADDKAQIAQRIQSVGDVGELGARLKSGFVGLIRSGTVLFATNFADGIAEFKTGLQGTGAAAVADATLAQYGKQSCKLTTGNVIGNQTTLSRREAVEPLSRFGIEVGFWAAAGLTDWRLNVEAEVIGDGGLMDWGVQITAVATGTRTHLRLLTNAGYPSLFLDSDLQLATGEWHNVKLICDNSTGPAQAKYTRLYFNGKLYDISAQAHWNGGGTPFVWPYLELLIRAEAMQAANQNINIGSVILTTDEP